MFDLSIKLIRFHFLAFGLVLAMPASATAETDDVTMYQGFCEASAAAILPDGRLVVASDDRKDLAVFSDANTVLLDAMHLGDVTDLEAAAQFGELTLWLTSHSTNKDGEDKEKRKLLLATTIDADGSLLMVGTPFRGLRSVISGPLQQAGHPLDVDSEPGWRDLNIESLAVAADGNALIGLRSPLINGEAVILRVSGLVDAVLSGNSPEVKSVQLVDLGGLAIRGMDNLSDGRVLILAGLPGDIPPGQESKFPRPQVFLWDGNAKTAKKIADLPAPMIGEAIIGNSDGRISVLGDNGDTFLANGVPCDDKKFPQAGAWFPVVEIALPTEN